MPTPFAAFILLLSYVIVFSTATQLLPAFKSVAEKRPATIRGLLDLAKRQGFCPIPQFPCEFNFCCPNIDWQCCFDGSCCQPDTYCVLASNGIVGCCPDGELCSGPVGPPLSTTFTIHTTTTRTAAHTLTTRFQTTIEPLPSTTPPVTTRSATTSSSSTSNISLTTTTPTFAFTLSTANNAITQSSNQPVLTPGLTSSVSGSTQDAGILVAILTYSFVVIAMVIL